MGTHERTLATGGNARTASGRPPFAFCFVIVADHAHPYVDMTHIAVACVRRIYHEACITLLVDDATLQSPWFRSHPLHASVDNVVTAGRFDGCLAARSRFAKTQMRQLMGGDFLFVDSDAILIRRCDEIELGDDAVGVCRDRFPGSYYKKWPDWLDEPYAKVGWGAPTMMYVNTGVMFWKDTPVAHALGVEWHRSWHTLIHQTGEHRDQLAFNHAIGKMRNAIRVLPMRYNAMVMASPWRAFNATVWHFFASTGRYGDTVFSDMLDRYKADKTINLELLEDAIRRRHPWRKGSLPKLLYRYHFNQARSALRLAIKCAKGKRN